MIATERVLPVWDALMAAQEQPLLRDEDQPRAVLGVVRRRLQSQIDWDAGWKTATRLGTMLQYAYEVPETLTRAFLVANAAIATLGASLKDLPGFDASLRDENRDAWDAPFYACWASCGAPPWGPLDDEIVAVRKAYWTWFIEQAFAVAATEPR